MNPVCYRLKGSDPNGPWLIARQLAPVQLEEWKIMEQVDSLATDGSFPDDASTDYDDSSDDEVSSTDDYDSSDH